MILSDQTIKDMMGKNELVIEPCTPDQVQPASVDCRLGNHYLVVEDCLASSIKLDSEIVYREIKGDKITIPPHSFLLATTQEYFKLPDDLTAFVEGRSSIGRIGLFIQNAGWVDPGFEGNITLELYNANSLPIELEAGRRICQMVFCKMDQKTMNPYRGKYQGQKLSTGSRAFLDHEVDQSL